VDALFSPVLSFLGMGDKEHKKGKDNEDDKDNEYDNNKKTKTLPWTPWK
jgi:hypothetical protein